MSPLLLGRPGTPMLAPDPPLRESVRFELTKHTLLVSGLLILEYTVQKRGTV